MKYPELVGIAKDTLTVIVIFVGGIVSWMKFVGGRADKVRLEPTVSCDPLYETDLVRLLVTVKLNNKGLFVAKIPQGGFTLEVSEPKSDVVALDIQNTRWNPIASYRVFVNHNAIQTGETAQEQLQISVKATRFSSLLLKLRVTHEGRKFLFLRLTKGTEWESTFIVRCQVTQNPSS